MDYNFIMTYSMYPLEKELKLKNCCFDNPRTGEEIKAVAEILKKANFMGNSAFPEKYEQFGTDVISLEMVIDNYFDRYKLDKKYLLKKNGKEYSDVYHKMAKNWVILRYDIDDENIKNFEDIYIRYQEVIAYINLLTFLSFSETVYKNHSFLIPECFDLLEIKTIDYTIKNIIINFVVLAMSKHNKDDINDFRFCSFDKIYKKFIELEKKIENSQEIDLIKYISTNIDVYISTQDEKMRIITLVSILELLLTHKPDSSRYNVEDSIKKQFCNKLVILLYLNDNKINYKELSCLLSKIYDLRSDIAHGNFKQIQTELNKIDKWLLENDSNYKKFYEKYNEDRVLEHVDEYLRDYVRISIKKYLEDKKLFEILKQ